MLSDQELKEMLTNYEDELNSQLIMEKEILRRGMHFPNRSERESVIWEMISENIIFSYKNELNWVAEMRQKLVAL